METEKIEKGSDSKNIWIWALVAVIIIAAIWWFASNGSTPVVDDGGEDVVAGKDADVLLHPLIRTH